MGCPLIIPNEYGWHWLTILGEPPAPHGSLAWTLKACCHWDPDVYPVSTAVMVTRSWCCGHLWSKDNQGTFRPYPTAVQTVKTCREMNRFGLSGFLRFLLHFCGVSYVELTGGFGMMTCPFQYAPSIHLLTVHIRFILYPQFLWGQCRLHGHCVLFVGLYQDWFRMCL
jgi:hypothetical protein